MLALLSHTEASLIDGLTPSTRKRLIRANAYPKPVLLSARRLGFVKAEVLEWATSRVAARDEGLPPAKDPVLVATGYGLGSTASRAGVAK
jgi:predicted DNA-binding transcriptional regulator AlpA